MKETLDKIGQHDLFDSFESKPLKNDSFLPALKNLCDETGAVGTWVIRRNTPVEVVVEFRVSVNRDDLGYRFWNPANVSIVDCAAFPESSCIKPSFVDEDLIFTSAWHSTCLKQQAFTQVVETIRGFVKIASKNVMGKEVILSGNFTSEDINRLFPKG